MCIMFTLEFVWNLLFAFYKPWFLSTKERNYTLVGIIILGRHYSAHAEYIPQLPWYVIFTYFRYTEKNYVSVDILEAPINLSNFQDQIIESEVYWIKLHVELHNRKPW